MLRVGVLVSGGGTNLQAIIDSIEAGMLDAEITLVVSSKRNAFALERARNAGIKAKFVSKRACGDLYDETLINLFEEGKTDVIVTAGFLTVLGRKFAEFYENRIINIHPALIPSFCGMGMYGIKVHEEVLKRGVKITGATVHFVNELADGGPIIMQKAVEVLDGDTPESLQLRVMEQAERVILPEVLRLISKNLIVVKEGKVEIRRQ